MRKGEYFTRVSIPGELLHARFPLAMNKKELEEFVEQESRACLAALVQQIYGDAKERRGAWLPPEGK